MNAEETVVVRTWRGATRLEDADRYVEYMLQTGFPGYRDVSGNLGAALLRRLTDDRAQFLFVSIWESRDAIRAFAGEHIDRAIFYPDDDAFLVERDVHVDHYDLVASDSERSFGVWPAAPSSE